MNSDCFVFVEERDEFRMWQGLVGPYYTPAVDSLGNLSWTNNGNLVNPPTVNVSGRGLTITGIVDTSNDLPETAPQYTCYLVGTTSPYHAYIFDGTSWTGLGIVGKGDKGDTGDDGFSPVVTVTTITGGHEVSIEDANGTQTFDVMDGQDGAPGQGVPSGGTTGQVLKKKSNTDYDTEWASAGGVDPATATPLMDGTAAVGSSTKYAREDHVHPSDTSKQDSITATGILKGSGAGIVSAAVAGTDYLTQATNYSPVFRLSPGASHAITSADSGKTFVDSHSSTASTLDILLTLSQADSSAFPVGAEIALTRINSKSTKLTVTGVRLFNADAGKIGSAGGSATIQIKQLGMAAIKKIESNNATYGDVWLLTGNVEVVT